MAHSDHLSNNNNTNQKQNRGSSKIILELGLDQASICLENVFLFRGVGGWGAGGVAHELPSYEMSCWSTCSIQKS